MELGSRDMILATDRPETLRGNRQEIKMKGSDWKKTERSGGQMSCLELIFTEHVISPHPLFKQPCEVGSYPSVI